MTNESIKKYLIRKKKAKVAHIFSGDDTLCRMYSTGGLAKKKYIISYESKSLPICELCQNNINHREKINSPENHAERLKLDDEQFWKKSCFEAQAEIISLKTKIAPWLGLKPFPLGQQVVWAENQEQAKSVLPGDSLFKFVDILLGNKDG